MADRRLVWNQLSAPDLSAASAAVARANQSFNNGFAGGSDILARYGEAQQAKADDAILAEIAGLNDEAAFDAFIDGGGLSGRNLSTGMRDHILGLRGGLVDIEGGRASNRQTDAQTGLIGANTNRVNVMTGIQSARESRTAADWMDGQRRQAAARENAGLFGTAQEFARNNGTTVGGITVTNPGERAIAYRNGIAAIESDGSGGYDAIGATHDTLGRALGRYQIMEANIPQWSRAALGREVSAEEFMANPDIQDAIFDHRFGSYVEQYGEENAARAWFGGEGGINNTGASDVHGRLTIGDYGQEFVANLGSTGRTETPSPVQEYRQALVATGLYTGPEINRMMADITGAGETRDAEVEERDAEILAERRAQAQIDALLDPNNLSGVDLGRDMLVDDRFTATENLGNLRAATGISEANPGLLTPDVQPDARVTGISDQINADLQAALASDNSQARLVDSIATFSNDPAGTLIEQLGIATDEQTPDYFQPEQVNRHINRVADEFNVTPEVAAAAMREIYIRDPGDDEQSSFWYDSDLTQNTVENRFPIADIGAIIEESLGQEQISGFRANRERAQAINQQVASINSQITRLQQQAAKGGDRTAISQQISDLMIQMAAIRSQNTDLFGTPSQ